LMGWDPVKKAFNFYRRPEGAKWVWKGDTRDAFRTATRRRGCFECHVHGVPVMKELRSPWNNWHSQAASIPPEAIPVPEVRNGPLSQNKSQAELLEPVVAGWITEALTSAVGERMKGDTLPNAADLLRPLAGTATVNLQTSRARSSGLSPTLDLPAGLFLN